MFGRTSLPDNLPKLWSYAQAKQRFETTVPIRSGRNKGIVPLGDNRRYLRSEIQKATTLEGEVIVCKYWDKDVFKFYPDGRIHMDIGNWHTPTTLMFMNDLFAGTDTGFTRYKGKIYYRDKDMHYYLNPVHGVWLNPEGSPHEPVPEYSKLLNKDKWKEVVKRFEPFLTYTQDMVKMSEPKGATDINNEYLTLLESYGDRIKEWGITNMPRSSIPYLTTSVKEIKYNRGKIMDVRKRFFELVTEACDKNDLELMYVLMFVLQYSASESSWQQNGYVYECNPARVRKHFYDLIKFEFCQEVFNSIQQPIGSLVADSNAKYFATPRA